MATKFEEFKNDVSVNNKSHDQWVDKNTNVNDIYWKLLYSNSAYSNRLANYPDSEEIRTNLKRLASIVSALAKESGFKLHINSGYRNSAVNSSIGGAKGSQHMKGQAVDLDVNSQSTTDKAKLFIFLLNSKNWHNKIDQMIWENNGQWVHVSFVCNTDKIGDDSSYSPRSYSNETKVYWMPQQNNYINIWSAKYKRGNDYNWSFENVPGLSGVKWDGKTYTVDYSKIGVADGSSLSGNGDGFITSGEHPAPPQQNYGGSLSRGANKVTKLSSARNRRKETDPNIDENRKKEFEALLQKMTEDAPELGREIIQSPEMYSPSILKGEQTSKKYYKKQKSNQ